MCSLTDDLIGIRQDIDELLKEPISPVAGILMRILDAVWEIENRLEALENAAESKDEGH